MEAANKTRPQLQLRPQSAHAPKHRPALSYPEPPVPESLPDRPGALLRLRELMRVLDHGLNRPLCTTRDHHGHTVWVMGTIGYRVDRRSKSVYVLVRDGVVRRGDYTVDLINFLRKPAWIGIIAGKAGLTHRGPQKPLFSTWRQVRDEERWLFETAYEILRHDARIRSLRRHRLAEALGLDPTLRGIALAARAFPDGDELGSAHFTHVWRHEPTFRTAARENPQLLPLVAIAMKERSIPPFDDAVEPLHDLLLESGLKRATWRYLVRHGVRWLRPAWEMAEPGKLMLATIAILRVFEKAGHPEPPPPGVMQDWAEWSCTQPVPEAPGDWRSVPASVVAACCEAARIRPLDAVRRAEIGLALEWGAATQPVLDKLQRRAGWSWVRRQATEWQRRWELGSREGPDRWPISLESWESGGYRARALGTLSGMVDAGLAFHNCLAGMILDCQNGLMQVYVIEEAASGRGVAVAAFVGHPELKPWDLADVLGHCNLEVAAAVRTFAVELLHAFNRAREAS